jgi:hypothetical protein
MQLGNNVNQFQSASTWKQKQASASDALKSRWSQAAQRMGADTTSTPGAGLQQNPNARLRDFLNSSMGRGAGGALDQWRAKYAQQPQNPLQPVNSGSPGSQFTPARQYMDRVSLHNNPQFSRYWPM